VKLPSLIYTLAKADNLHLAVNLAKIAAVDIGD
jgi:hypothetical protein